MQTVPQNSRQGEHVVHERIRCQRSAIIRINSSSDIAILGTECDANGIFVRRNCEPRSLVCFMDLRPPTIQQSLVGPSDQRNLYNS
ncbi:hypothetical protein CDAR_239131 [Caerostris darwini]|uniref:Uncharacterized protein n=1 Tax=Caerostris darwini TaxID=1538125 RepID=A0AAV4P180_9ARAC|nr:hypothetical protein CDAR_239131 [Caerostris darwini]